jgi:hypothetical protein
MSSHVTRRQNNNREKLLFVSSSSSAYLTRWIIHLHQFILFCFVSERQRLASSYSFLPAQTAVAEDETHKNAAKRVHDMKDSPGAELVLWQPWKLFLCFEPRGEVNAMWRVEIESGKNADTLNLNSANDKAKVPSTWERATIGLALLARELMPRLVGAFYSLLKAEKRLFDSQFRCVEPLCRSANGVIRVKIKTLNRNGSIKSHLNNKTSIDTHRWHTHAPFPRQSVTDVTPLRSSATFLLTRGLFPSFPLGLRVVKSKDIRAKCK